MRDSHAPLIGTMQSFLVHRHDLSPATMANYRIAIAAFASWCESVLGRPAEIGDVEPGTVEQYLSERKTSGSAQTARSAWVALRSAARFLAEQRIHHDQGQSMLRLVRMPKVKDESRRALTDDEMWHLIERSAEGESGKRDSAIVWTLLGCGLRREELAGLRLGDVDLTERRLHIKAATTKSVHPRDVNLPVETLKALDIYIADHRKGGGDADEPLFIDRRGNGLTGNAVRKLFERLEARTGIRGLCAHMLRHTWATNFHRSRSGTRFDLMVEGGWTTGRMVERYTKGAAVRGTPQGALTIHRVTRCAKREAAVREGALTEEKRPGRKAHRVASQ